MLRLCCNYVWASLSIVEGELKFLGLVLMCSQHGNFTSRNNVLKPHENDSHLALWNDVKIPFGTHTKLPYMPSNHESYSILCLVVIMENK